MAPLLNENKTKTMCKNQVAEISTKRVGNVRNQFAFCIILIQFICVHYSYFSNKIILQYFFTGACWVFFSWDILVSQLTVGYTAIINSIFNISSHDLMCNRSRKKVYLAQSFLLPQPVLGVYRRVCSVPLSEYIPSHVLLKGSANARCSSMI